LSITDFQRWGCNDYVLVDAGAKPMPVGEARSYVVMSPRDLVLVQPRDRRDHVVWLVERKRYEEALSAVEQMEAEEQVTLQGDGGRGSDVGGLSVSDIGQRYIEHLVSEGAFLFPSTSDDIN